MAFIIVFFFSGLIALYASSQGRSFLFWFLISAIFTPLLGFIALLIVSRLMPSQPQERHKVLNTTYQP